MALLRDRHYRRGLVQFIIWIFFILGCTEQPTPGKVQEMNYIQRILDFRKAKNDSFLQSPNSPLPEPVKSHFTGLPYFPLNPSLRFELQLNKIEHADTILITTTDGTDSPAIRYGYFEFDLKGQKQRLYVYKMMDSQKRHPGHLFIPFMDATTGTASYGGGRYIDLLENASNQYIVDFNLAFNPSCAYGNDSYRCPIPPAENILKVPILAGEKNWQK